MKVKDLIVALQKYNPEYDVILSQDSEGNGFSPVDEVTPETYKAENTWSGEIGISGTNNVVVLWPT